ncbi:unnamed protein product, partial [Prorocentrum cordatum]
EARVSAQLAGRRLFECAFVSQDFDFVTPYWQPAYVYGWDAPVTVPRWRPFVAKRSGTILRARGLRDRDMFPRRYNFEGPSPWLWRPELHQRLGYSLHSSVGPDCPEESSRSSCGGGAGSRWACRSAWTRGTSSRPSRDDLALLAPPLTPSSSP